MRSWTGRGAESRMANRTSRAVGCTIATASSGRPSRSICVSSRRRHTRFDCDWSSDVCSSDLIANLLSYYGENKIDQWMIPFFGKSAYEDPDVYAKSSPITFIRKVKTPTLVLVGDSDEIGRASCRERV